MKELIYLVYVKLFARVKFVRFNRFIVTLGLKGLGISNYENRRVSGEKNLIFWLQNHSLLDVVFDVGANEGIYANICLENGSKNIFCFEPVKNTFERLSIRFEDNAVVSCHNIGFSDKQSKMKIFDKMISGTSHASLYSEAIGEEINLFMSEIELNTIDNFCTLYNIGHINLLKIDTEGHEFSVLTGAQGMLSKQAIDAVHFEFNLHNIYSGKFLRDFRLLLKDFDFFRLLPNEFSPINYNRPEMEEFFFFQNIFAIRKDLSTLNCLNK